MKMVLVLLLSEVQHQHSVIHGLAKPAYMVACVSSPSLSARVHDSHCVIDHAQI